MFQIASGAIQGARDNQEDCMEIRPAPGGMAGLAIVADGMGGHAGGEIASALAVAGFAEHFENYTRGPLPKRLEIALAMANQALAHRVREDVELDGMGTTLLAVHYGPEGLHWVSVGDSPLLLVRNGEARWLNEDHSMAPLIERQVAAGKLTREQADRHPERNSLLSVLTGLNTPDMIDCPAQPLVLQDGDRVIAASDGLLTLSLSDIAARVLAADSASEAVALLLDGVAMRGLPFQDNASVQIIMVG
ncbi:protein phosphatase 2C domain-containing protein (plasmid) [Novosphingobium sp. BL-8H]|uniref:PP2C family protein-serine/threonine phosphatase n=1 Tax=Novosphingobium sp. BL-8H TaxID=3127640 RepID=UPI0037580386